MPFEGCHFESLISRAVSWLSIWHCMLLFSLSNKKVQEKFTCETFDHQKILHAFQKERKVMLGCHAIFYAFSRFAKFASSSRNYVKSDHNDGFGSY